MRIFSHARGNPDTEVSRNLSRRGSRERRTNPMQQEVGESSLSVKRSQEPLGSRIGHSTPRAGKPSTWGRARREPVAHKGNMPRICQAGTSMPTLLRGIANKSRHRFPDLFGLLNVRPYQDRTIVQLAVRARNRIRRDRVRSEGNRGARCGNTARRDLCGGRRVTGVPTATCGCKAGEDR